MQNCESINWFYFFLDLKKVEDLWLNIDISSAASANTQQKANQQKYDDYAKNVHTSLTSLIVLPSIAKQHRFSFFF